MKTFGEIKAFTEAVTEAKTEADVPEPPRSGMMPTTAHRGDLPPAREIHAKEARLVFEAAWKESTEAMKLIPEKDAKELELSDWYDLKLRIAQFIAIQTDRHTR